MAVDSNPPNPIVFISYAHEGGLGGQVRNLAEWLTGNGVRVITDHPYVSRPPEQGWRAWMQDGIEQADVVLIVCTERYKKLFEKKEVPGDGGRGATWESAVITDTLYQSHMRNSRLYPILPDGGDSRDIPVVLRDWDNNHRFPSGNGRILSLIRDEVTIPAPKGPFQRLLPGELSGSDDPRLQAREGEVIGRNAELAEVAGFLGTGAGSAAVCGHVTGSGGIGKTEVCKAALKEWLANDNATRAFYIQVDDHADAPGLLNQLGEAVGVPPDTLARIQQPAQMRPHLPGGLYYLDNLEHVAESEGGIQLLRGLTQTPGLRFLASSRVALDTVLGPSITIDRLDTDSSCALFLKVWNGKQPPDVSQLRRFVDEELGGHALSITLLARLGRAYSWESLLKEWQRQGTRLAEIRRPCHRLDSLSISFVITRELLAREPGTLELWLFAALFPGGPGEDALDHWERISGHGKARLMLIDHNLLRRENHHMTMLPPVARYALDQAHLSNHTGNDFSWANTRKYAYQYFIDLSRFASETVSSDAAIESRSHTAGQLPAIERLLATDAISATPATEMIRNLHRQLQNTYMFNVRAGRTVLSLTHKLLADGLSLKILGDLESRLGHLEEARSHYDQAIDLYQKEQAQLGLANVYQSRGDLMLSANMPEQALPVYEKALAVYQSEQEPMGQAYTLAEIIRCRYRLGQLDDFAGMAGDALAQAAASNASSVRNYVLEALLEACNKDEDRLQSFLSPLEDQEKG